MISRRSRLLYVVAWIPPALLYAAAIVAQPNVLWWHAVVTGFVIMSAGAVLGLGVWHLAQRVPLDQVSRARIIGVHFAGAVIYGAAWTAVQSAWLWLVAGAATMREVTAQAGLWQFMMGVCVYLLIAGISYLILSQKHLRDRERAIAQAEAAAARAQLQAVRAQLNPHFLFNALHAVSALVQTDPQQADLAIQRLGDLLRRSLEQGESERIPLGQEWQLVRDYLEIEQLRLGDRLRIRNELDPATLAVLVPPLILQPLVENAVKHGISSQPRGGTITVQSTRANGQLELTVSDDGRGTSNIDSGGFGLEGVRKQIEGRYGEAASMEITSEPGQGFAVRLRIPVGDA